MRYLQHVAQLLLLAALVGCDGGRVAGPVPGSDARPSTQLGPAGPALTLAGEGIEAGDDGCPIVHPEIAALRFDRDDDNDGLTNANETLFGLFSSDADSDDDGIPDGNDDSNGNGQDDEDEDDDDECPDDDSDGDGVDDEDEDDNDDGQSTKSP